MEDASQGGLDGSVVAIDRFWVVRSAPRAEWPSRSEQGFDGFVAQDEERRHRPETGRQRLVAASVADAAGGVPAAGVFPIINRVAGVRALRGFRSACATPRAPPGGRATPLRGAGNEP